MIFWVTVINPVNIMPIKALNSIEVFDASNQARKRFGAEPLNNNIQLMNAAQQKAEDMVQKRYFAHKSPDGAEPWDYFKKVDYSYELAGENLAITNESVDKVVDGWLNSISHRDNLLNTKFQDTGIGIANYGKYKNYENTIVVVALYGTKKSNGMVSGTERTYPSGIATVMQPRIFNIDSRLFFSVATGLIVAGALLEIRHIKKHAHPRSNLPV
jgi:hypothetical protein